MEGKQLLNMAIITPYDKQLLNMTSNNMTSWRKSKTVKSSLSNKCILFHFFLVCGTDAKWTSLSWRAVSGPPNVTSAGDVQARLHRSMGAQQLTSNHVVLKERGASRRTVYRRLDACRLYARRSIPLRSSLKEAA